MHPEFVEGRHETSAGSVGLEAVLAEQAQLGVRFWPTAAGRDQEIPLN